MRLGDLDLLKDGLKCHYQSTDEKYETDRQWAIGYNAGLNRALHSITYAKTVDAVPVVHGFWKETDESVGWGEEPCAKCSACDELWVLGEWDFDDFKTFMHYCPNCGARMDGEAE